MLIFSHPPAPTKMVRKYWKGWYPDSPRQQVYRHNFYLCQVRIHSKIVN